MNDKVICKNNTGIVVRKDYEFKTTRNYSIGDNIMSVGFGKFSYSPNIFRSHVSYTRKLLMGRFEAFAKGIQDFGKTNKATEKIV